MDTQTKSIFQSKTVWFNVLAAIILIAQMFGYGEFQADTEIMSFVTIVANLALRFMTNKGISLNGQ